MPQNSQSLDKVLTLAAMKGASIGTKDVNVPCLVVAIAAENSSLAHRLIMEAGLTADTLERTARNLYGTPNAGAGTAALAQPEVGRDAQEALAKAAQVAEKNKHIYTTPTHLLHQLVKHPDGQRVLKSAFLTLERRGNQQIVLPGGTVADGNLTPEQRLKNLTAFLDEAVKTNVNGLPAGEGAMTTMLDQMTVDLTKLARENKIPPIIGRTKEIRRAIEILGRQTKNNPVFIGEPGVGKTAIAEGLAVEIAFDRVPKSIKGKRLLRLDLTALVAGTKYRGEFEERMKQLLVELTSTKDCIVFIDELHTLIGAGAAQGAMDASNTLKPALARGEITAIGATTLDEYRRHIEKDGALERRFQTVIVEPSSAEETIEILRGRKKTLEDHHAVTISDAAIVAASYMADRYIQDRFLPDKAIDLIDEACSALAIDFPGTELSVENINAKVSQMTGIKLDKLNADESSRLSNMEAELHKRVVGQNSALSAVSRAVRRARAGLKDNKTPIGSFLFLGPTGVGKTEVSRALQGFLFDDEKTLLRLDMSEYMEKHSVSRMIGAPPGYVGYEEGGTLTEAVRRKPYSVVLFDEIEKAHPDVFNVLLQVLDDGRLTDGQGRTVDFKNTIIIMTSNIGAGQIIDMLERLGESCSQEDLLAVAMPLVKHMFRPEFLNRLDEVVCFGQLSRDELAQVLVMQLADLLKRLKSAHDMSIDLTDEARKVVVAAGYDPQFGARPMKRAVRRLLEDPIAEKIIDGGIKRGAQIKVTAEGNQLILDAVNPVKEEQKPEGEGAKISLSKDPAPQGEVEAPHAVSLKKDDPARGTPVSLVKDKI